MGLASLAGFMTLIWIMILSLAAFLVIFVAEIDIIFNTEIDRPTISGVQAAVAIILLLVLIAGLSKLKKFYIRKKLLH